MRHVSDRARLVVATALVAAMAAVAYVLLHDDSYTIHAPFENAGLLVKGGQVQVAGRKVGSITGIGLTADGLADVTMSIDDHRLVPLRRGTRAAIRAVGQAGVANRFVDLSPGSADAPALPSGGTLGLDQTSGIVNIDALLDSFGPHERRAMQALVKNSAAVYAGSGARSFNEMVAKLSPTLEQLNGLYGDLARDRGALTRLVTTAAQAATAIASRRTDLQAALGNMTRSFGAIARERGALADTFQRAPAALAQARTTLAHTSGAVTALRPALRELRPAAPPVRGFLARLSSTLPAARPVVAQLNGQLPSLDRGLEGLGPLQSPTVGALRSTQDTMQHLRPLLRAMRIYGADFILGIFNGIAAVAAGPYNEQGHYARLSYVQSPQTTLSGRGASLGVGPQDLVPGIIGARTKQVRRCPGGNTAPAPDGSSPWVPDSALCDPNQTTSAEVNQP
jgi:phospholipid/cholesterol/gamma-HCH transport system substrate-binding protein